MKYRSDIDGLRALAIVSVVLYHLSFPNFSGGYVGVDVFFVISGFLITSIIYHEMLEGTFSFAQFYERRIRRLFPSLFCVIAVTVTLAAHLLLPSDFRSFSESLVAATVFGANIFYWKTSGYFDGPVDLAPLLHMWSLSVEEQFYILFPAILLVVVKYARQYVRVALIIALLISFFASLMAVERQQEAAFYLTVFRAWELLIGALLAINALPRPSTHVLRHFLSLIGLGLIIYSVFSFSAETTFPGVYAIIPSLGAGLIIYAGIGMQMGERQSIVNEVLSWRPLVLIGLISYSLYLWHWPLIVFAKYYALRDLTTDEKLGLLAVSILIASFSWRYIEQPFRGRTGLIQRKQLFALSSMMISISITVGLAGHFTNGFPQRVPKKIVEIAKVADQNDHWRKNCQNLPVASITQGDVCALGEKNGAEHDFLLWGDSHALAMAPAFHEVAMKKQRNGWFIGRNACPPLMGVERLDTHQGCAPYNEAVGQFIEQHPEIRTVYLVGRWGLHANGLRYGRESGPPAVISPKGIASNPEAFEQGLVRTLGFLKRRGISVIFIMGVPEVGWLVPSALARAEWFGYPAPVGPTLEAYRARQNPVKVILARVKANNDLRVVGVAHLFCPEGHCIVEHDGIPLYRDDDHLSTQGAQFATPLIADLL